MKMPNLPSVHVVPALAFGFAVLEAVHMSSFVSLTLRYRGNIRGYVPAGLTGLMVLFVASVALLIYLGSVGWRRHVPGRYLLAGIVSAPVALLAFRTFSTFYVSLIGSGRGKDVAINSIGAIICALIAVKLQRSSLCKASDRDE